MILLFRPRNYDGKEEDVLDNGKALFPVAESPQFVRESETLDKRYKPTVSWDCEKGDFVLNGKNQIQTCSGVDGYKTWCCKMALTQRYSCLAYPDELGADLDEALAEPDEKAVESALERTITETLAVNPRTEYVRGFQFFWNGDVVRCTFTVKGINEEEFEVNI